MVWVVIFIVIIIHSPDELKKEIEELKQGGDYKLKKLKKAQVHDISAATLVPEDFGGSGKKKKKAKNINKFLGKKN